MAEELIIAATGNKKTKYDTLLPQIKALIEEEQDLIANLANVCAALKQTFNFFWVGFYIVKNGQLVLGPFQGPLACTRIDYGKGVCGAAWKESKTIVVPDVELFPGHIACSSASKSEIVVPGYVDEKVFFVLDVDSDRMNDFDSDDAQGLEAIIRCVEKTAKTTASVA
jgi:L-methionine (R)-S-oxide reductase